MEDELVDLLMGGEIEKAKSKFSNKREDLPPSAFEQGIAHYRLLRDYAKRPAGRRRLVSKKCVLT